MDGWMDGRMDGWIPIKTLFVTNDRNPTLNNLSERRRENKDLIGYMPK